MYQMIVSLLEPFPILCLLLALGLVSLWRRRTATRGQLLWLSGVFALLVLGSTPAVAYLALGSLEWAYPPQNERPDDVEAIVVLSGGVSSPDKVRQDAELGHNSLLRCLHAAKLYHQGKPCLVVLTGGKTDPNEPGPTVAATMREFLLQLGVRDADLLIEDRSATTYENAWNTAELLRQRGIEKIVLVTSASHMMRSQRCFRAQGLQVLPSTCDWQATRFRWRLDDFLPSPGAARQVQFALHEWMGTAWYWLRGRI